MRRVYILLGLILPTVLLTGVGSSVSSGKTALMPRYAAAAPQQPCCPEGQVYPHDTCIGGTCTTVYECGVSDCIACTGCDPQARWNCIYSGWTWDESTCSCLPPSCDPYARYNCLIQGGQWNDWDCTCFMPCNPGPPILVQTTQTSMTFCYGGGGYSYTTYIYTTRYYVQYCQDGSLYASWSEQDPYPQIYLWCWECVCPEEGDPQ
jgi:hypothetical protein